MKPIKTLKFTLALLILLLAFGSSFGQQSHQFATFNIRFDNAGDEGNLWKDRSPHVASLIQFHQIGLFGTQEGLQHQIKELSETLDFEYLGVGRDDGAEKGEFTAILFDPKKYELLDQSTFWLSPTPEKPSKGWDAALNRICTWGKFKNQGGESFYVFNIHYDHIGQQAREESSKLVIQKIAEINTQNLPVILLGDFNVTPDNPAYTTITKSADWQDARLISEIPAYGPEGTFTGFDWEKMPDGIIDHIFVHGDVKVIRHGILTDNYGKKYPSDHFPVMVEIEF
ncbi:endonuclease/exonuclease/phosphatase family protein [Algoriphagus hitonicola]|uniref:Metal-dependent hydrolase, endonuclease/exonuclease/phosphatase family n=1 Tax=Algoriphagus hitonicola TaxID=435880 RepID=A0A1I2VBJ1_9BACT|nr:endonuclease/exonuclease/phosphatase family protein [Algoriphagus hitonicola]SFG85547.1 Metal-dependent hydrolase, endonuclease/exonuclease/phosphatase family [Algoriphagus hitonicola]